MSYPYEIFGSQDTKDDDGQVIDNFFIETDAPPKLDLAVEPIPASPKENPVKMGRLLTGSVSMTLAVFTSPTQILPADPNRKSLVVSAFSSAASPNAYVECVEISDENGKVSGTAGFNLRPIQGAVVINDYTGAIWAMPGYGITAPIELTWIAVTG
jgi:hypothetical protein